MSTPATDLFGHDCANTDCLDRDHWQAAAQTVIADLDTLAMTAELYRQLTADLLTYPRKSPGRRLLLIRS